MESLVYVAPTLAAISNIRNSCSGSYAILGIDGASTTQNEACIGTKMLHTSDAYRALATSANVARLGRDMQQAVLRTSYAILLRIESPQSPTSHGTPVTEPPSCCIERTCKRHSGHDVELEFI